MPVVRFGRVNGEPILHNFVVRQCGYAQGHLSCRFSWHLVKACVKNALLQRLHMTKWGGEGSSADHFSAYFMILMHILLVPSASYDSTVLKLINLK